MTDRTKGPWYTEGEGLRVLIRGADITIVAARHRLDRETHEANFAAIIKWENHFDDLVAALEEALAFVDPHADPTARTTHGEFADKLRAILTKVKSS